MKPLDGIRVLDMSRYIAGPYGALLLAQFGAEVIKIEPPDVGDECRTWEPVKNGFSGYFSSNNRGKKSFSLNLKNPESRKVLDDLIAKSDVFLHNYTDSVCRKFKMQYSEISKINPQIIYCGVSGFGEQGPYKDRKGFDTIFQAMGGLTWLTGEKEGEPIKAGAPVADVSSGIFSALSIITALYNRQKTGCGEKIDMALVSSLINFLPVALAFYSLTGESPVRMGSEHMGRVPSAVFKCKTDDYVHISVTDPQWRALVDILKISEFAQDNYYDLNNNRLAKRDYVMEMLQNAIRDMPRSELVEKCMQKGIPCGEVLSIDEVVEDQQIKFRESVGRMPTEEVGEFLYAKYPAKFSNIDTEMVQDVPKLGEHTEDILRNMLNYDDNKIKMLQEIGVV